MNSLLDVRQLHAFAVVSRTRNITIAARELFLTPSAVSHAIIQLEETVHCRLLDRRQKKIELTPAGEQLLEEAEHILQRMTAAKTSLENFTKPGRSRIRVAANSAFCESILCHILRAFLDRYPGSGVVAETLDTMEALQYLHDNKVDLAIGLDPPLSSSTLEFTPLLVDHPTILVGPDHAWAQAGAFELASLSSEPFLMYKPHSLFSVRIREFLQSKNIEPNLTMTTADMGLIKRLVALNQGVTILPSWASRPEVADRRLISVRLVTFPMRWGLISFRERRRTLAEETFQAIARKISLQFQRDLETAI